MKWLMIIGAYLSAGMSFTMFIMWIDAKHPDLNTGIWDNGAAFLLSVTLWPLLAVFMGLAFLFGFCGTIAKAIYQRMKEDAKK